jgi:hypothetical protein
MHLLARILTHAMTFLAGMAFIVYLQVEMAFPTPDSYAVNGGFIHPLYSFSSWVYALVVLLLAAIAVAFGILGRSIRRNAFEL